MLTLPSPSIFLLLGYLVLGFHASDKLGISGLQECETRDNIDNSKLWSCILMCLLTIQPKSSKGWAKFTYEQQIAGKVFRQGSIIPTWLPEAVRAIFHIKKALIYCVIITPQE